MAEETGKTGARGAFVYAAMIGGTVGVFLLVRGWGAGLVAPPAVADAPTFGGPLAARAHTVLHVLLALVVVTAAARALGVAFRRMRQPPVVGEILAGILLGPSLVGRIAPSVEGFVFPATVAPLLSILAQVGVILYMFLVGLELDPGLLRKRTHTAVAISHASIVAPFLLGSLLALAIYPRLSTADVPFTCFALFVAVSMSVTAFPVLARILTDAGLQRSRLGAVALTCAAVDDVTAWCLLALVVGIARARADAAVRTVLLAAGFVTAMLFVVRPLLARGMPEIDRRMQSAGRGVGRGILAVVCVALLLSALATEAIGIHAIFGAFLLGVVIPHDSVLARRIVEQLEDLVVVLFLPAFFAFTGLRTQIGLLQGTTDWLICGAIIAVACAGKFGGSLVAGRFAGLRWREAASIGALMNTRGLMELIVLNIGLDLHVLSPTLFAMLVIMAVVTTAATAPALELIAEPALRAAAA